MQIYLLENTVDIASTVHFSQKSVEIDCRCGFIPQKSWSISTVDVPSYQKKIGGQSISTVEVDMEPKKP